MHNRITVMDGLLDYPGAQAAIKTKRIHPQSDRDVNELKSHMHRQQAVIINLDSVMNNNAILRSMQNRTSFMTEK